MFLFLLEYFHEFLEQEVMNKKKIDTLFSMNNILRERNLCI